MTRTALVEKRNNLFNQMEDLKKRAVDGILPAEDHATFMRMFNETKQLKEMAEAAEAMAQIQSFGEKVEERTQKDEHAGKVTHEGAFTKWLRGGQLDAQEREFLQPAMQFRGTATQIAGTPGLGGYLVPQSWADEIYKIMTAWGGVLGVCRMIDTDSGETFNFPVTNDTEEAVVIAESDANVVGDSTLTNITLGSFMFSTKIMKASIQLLRDSKYDVAGWIRETLGERMGKGTNRKFTTGAGTTEPLGVATASTLGATHTTVTKAKLMELKYAVTSPYRINGRWMMNSATLGTIAALAIGSADDRGLWQPNMTLGEPDSILGHPVVVNEHCESISADDTRPVLFGDFKQFRVRRIGGFEIFPFNELYMPNLHKAWLGYAAFDSKLFNTAAIKHLLTT